MFGITAFASTGSLLLVELQKVHEVTATSVMRYVLLGAGASFALGVSAAHNITAATVLA